MATDSGFVDALLDALEGAGDISAKKMFGEYGLYLDGKMVGLICDNRFLIKAPESALDLVAEFAHEPPYRGSTKVYPIVPEDKWDDREFMISLVRQSWAALPFPKPKAPRKSKAL